MPTCLVLQHLDIEAPYAIADALATRGVEVSIWRMDELTNLPTDLDQVDGVVVMGGPMSVASDAGFPSRRAELSLIRDALQRRLPVLGVCLGAQLLAAAAGGEVFRGPAGAEIGWEPVELLDAASEDGLLGGLPRSLDVLHWHGDTYQLPPGAVRLASSARYAEQAFRVGGNAWGLQFHLEVTSAAVRSFATAFADEATAAGVDPTALGLATPDKVASLQPWRDVVLGRFGDLLVSAAAVSR